MNKEPQMSEEKKGFDLNKQVCKIANLNFRSEKHGEDTKLAVDIKIVTDVSNGFLAYLHPTLKSSLYAKDEANPDLIDEHHMPVRRYPEIPEIKWALSMPKIELVLHGDRKANDIQLEATIDKLRLAPKEGGTVTLTFRAQVHPSPNESGKLSALLDQDVKVSILEAAADPASDVNNVQPLFGSAAQ
jgi:hypothetical protein